MIELLDSFLYYIKGKTRNTKRKKKSEVHKNNNKNCYYFTINK